MVPSSCLFFCSSGTLTCLAILSERTVHFSTAFGKCMMSNPCTQAFFHKAQAPGRRSFFAARLPSVSAERKRADPFQNEKHEGVAFRSDAVDPIPRLAAAGLGAHVLESDDEYAKPQLREIVLYLQTNIIRVLGTKMFATSSLHSIAQHRTCRMPAIVR